jgi:hypothetical protein
LEGIVKQFWIVIFASVAILCFGLTASRGTDRPPFSDATGRQQDDAPTTERSESAKRSEHFDKLIRQQQRQIDTLRNQLLAKERKLDTLLMESRRLGIAHRPAIVTGTTSFTGSFRWDVKNEFRKGDRLVVVRRTAQNIRIVGQGTIKDHDPSDGTFFVGFHAGDTARRRSLHIQSRSFHL